MKDLNVADLIGLRTTMRNVEMLVEKGARQAKDVGRLLHLVNDQPDFLELLGGDALLKRVTAGMARLQQYVGVNTTTSPPHFTRLVSEAEAVSVLSTVMSETEAGKLVEKCFRASVDHFNYHGSPFWRVRAGFTQKTHAPQLGPCYKGFEYLQDWNFEDGSINDSVLFCPPRLLPESLEKSVDEQNTLLVGLRDKFELPTYFFKSFGAPSTLSGIILTNYNQTGEQVPLNKLWARTDAFIHDGDIRLYLGDFGRGGLSCGSWYWSDEGCSGLGCFALGEVGLG